MLFYSHKVFLEHIAISDKVQQTQDGENLSCVALH